MCTPLTWYNLRHTSRTSWWQYLGQLGWDSWQSRFIYIVDSMGREIVFQPNLFQIPEEKSNFNLVESHCSCYRSGFRSSKANFAFRQERPQPIIPSHLCYRVEWMRYVVSLCKLEGQLSTFVACKAKESLVYVCYVALELIHLGSIECCLEPTAVTWHPLKHINNNLVIA